MVARTLVWDAEELYRVREKSPRRSSVNDGIADSGKRVGTWTALLSPSCPIDSDPMCLLEGHLGTAGWRPAETATRAKGHISPCGLTVEFASMSSAVCGVMGGDIPSRNSAPTL